MVGKGSRLGDVVYVTWVDSEYRAGWIDKDDLKDNDVEPCRTVAFFHSATREFLFLYGSESTDQYMSCLVIPQCAVRGYKTMRRRRCSARRRAG